mmetsp:Transcript_92308/g.261323  ORF Transcript_92308/g.261323 Transcript_92308/m.261323 type:complete len:95 (-) Transcript_92308:709-993(-)
MAVLAQRLDPHADRGGPDHGASHAISADGVLRLALGWARGSGRTFSARARPVFASTTASYMTRVPGGGMTDPKSGQARGMTNMFSSPESCWMNP